MPWRCGPVFVGDAAAAAVRVAEAAAMIVVVGIGADGMAGLPPASRPNWHRATVIYGSQRQLDLLDDTVTARAPGMAVADAACPGHVARRSTGDVHVRRQRRPAAARRRRHADPAVRRGPGHGAAARVVGDAGLRAARLGGAGHRDHQPVTAEPHTAVRRGGQAVVLSPRRRQPRRAGPAARRHRSRRLRTDRARATRRAGGASPLGHRARVGGQSTRRRRRTST